MALRILSDGASSPVCETLARTSSRRRRHGWASLTSAHPTLSWPDDPFTRIYFVTRVNKPAKPALELRLSEGTSNSKSERERHTGRSFRRHHHQFSTSKLLPFHHLALRDMTVGPGAFRDDMRRGLGTWRVFSTGVDPVPSSRDNQNGSSARHISPSIELFALSDQCCRLGRRNDAEGLCSSIIARLSRRMREEG